MGKMLTNGSTLPKLFAPSASGMGQEQLFTVYDAQNGAWRNGAALYEGGVKLGTVSGSGASLSGDIRSFVRSGGVHSLSAACTGSVLRESAKTAFPAAVEMWAVNVSCSHCHIEIAGGSYGTAGGFVTLRKPDLAGAYVTITAVPDAGYTMSGGTLTVNGVSAADPAEYRFAVSSVSGNTITIGASATATVQSGIRLGNSLTDSRMDSYITLAVQDGNRSTTAYYLFEEDGSIGIFTGRPNQSHQRLTAIDPAAGILSFYLVCPYGYEGSCRFTMNGQLIECSGLATGESYLYTGGVVFTRFYQTAIG